MQTKNPHFNDISVGKNSLQKKKRELSQKQLDDHLGVTFQQIQKYKKGINSVEAELLQEITKILDVPLSFTLTSQ
ncbi:helix-turn-helix domain-containing protein [Bartonella refiksaydamii]|uniref:helix-turn-helix domain-containing protein n=1 Tax=Bartonella refiksaydamii TaxID=2654951 RepID=UPI0012EC25CC|nr:helix-turn-helix transcriptional regulator [Bartonella refiksaydamii]